MLVKTLLDLFHTQLMSSVLQSFIQVTYLLNSPLVRIPIAPRTLHLHCSRRVTAQDGMFALILWYVAKTLY